MLKIELLTLSNAQQKGEKYLKIYFRETSFKTRPFGDDDHEGTDLVNINESFIWNINEKAITQSDFILIKLFQQYRFSSNKLIAIYKHLLNNLIKSESKNEHIVNANFSEFQIKLSFNLCIGEFEQKDKRRSSTLERSSKSLLSLSKNIFSTEIKHQKMPEESDSQEANSDFVIVDLNSSDLTPTASNAQQKPAVTISTVKGEQNEAIREPILIKSLPESVDTKLKDIKSKHFQICVKVIECKRLQGINIDPFVTVQVVERKKHTAVKKSTNAPYFDEYFVFDLYEQQKRLFDKLITFTCSHSKNLLQSDDVIGVFQLDIGTVYEQVNHQFLGKWIPLLNPTTGESSGYIKCDITVQTKEEVGARVASRSPSEERETVQPTEARVEEVIEKNLLLPAGVTERQLVKLVVKIFKADCLPRCDAGVGAALKKAFTAGTKDIINPYVVVSFAGLQGKTSVVKKTCYPIWNQQITFTYLFPPLFQNIKLQVFDAATGSDDVIATYYLPIKKISNNDSDGDGYLPTFGPMYVYLYGAPRDSCDDDYEDLNDGLQEGVAFRGRLLMGITTKFIEAPETEKEVTVESISPLSEKYFGEEEEYLLYANIFDSDMLSSKYADKAISYEISIGDPDDIDGDGMITDADKKALKDYKGVSAAIKPAKCFTNKQKDHFYVPINNEKLTMWSKSKWFNNRKALYDINIVSSIIRNLELCIADVEALYDADHPQLGKRLLGVLDQLTDDCKKFLARLTQTDESKLKSKLAKEKLKEKIDLFERMIKNTLKVKRTISSSLELIEPGSYEILYEIAEKLREIERNVEETYPDIFLTLLAGGKRVAFARLRVRDFMFSKETTEKGVHCGVGKSIFIYSPAKNMMKLRNRVFIYVWFGLYEHKAHCIDGLPKGYRVDNAVSKIANIQTPPPSSIIYDERHQFELRAHIFQARSLIAADASGLSDPYAKIYFVNSCLISQVVNQTLSPTWDEMLVSTSVALYGSKKDLLSSNIYLVIEIFDEDTVGDDEFIGRAIGKCTIRFKDTPYTPPHLKWINIFRTGEPGGQLLGSFELLQVGDLDSGDTYPKRLPVRKPGNVKYNIYPVPEVIKPTLSRYRLAVLFWGLRSLKKVKMLSVDKPRVDIECGGQLLSSTTIKNCKQSGNFLKPLKYLEVELPDQEFYCPPINITVVDCCSFGRSTLVGTHVINSVGKLMISPTESKNSIKPLGKLFTVNKSDVVYIEQLPDDDVKSNGASATDTVVTIVKPAEATILNDEDDDDWWTRYYASKKFISKTPEFEFSFGSVNNKTTEETSNGVVPKCRLFLVFNRELEKVSKYEHGFKRIKSYDLHRGKNNSNKCDEKNKIGTLKGIIHLYKYPLELYDVDPLTLIPKNEPVRLLVRCYLVRAYDITPKDSGGKADLYPLLKLGEQRINDRANYIPNQLSPIFGRVYEFDATFPLDTLLSISLKDYDLVGGDDLVGTTVIDLEDRFYSNNRATCGLSRIYETEGINRWRDGVKPSQLLIDLCRDLHLPIPLLTADSIKIGEMTFKLTPEEQTKIPASKITQDHLALSLLNQWKKIFGFSLVAEHVETRNIYDPKYPGISQGKLEMWVDIFPKDRPIPAPIDIKPRDPNSYELRLIIWNTADVILDDTNIVTGEKMSDIFVKGWLQDARKSQSTDVHYRSLTGEGNFNWRFIFPFDYLPSEECIVTKKKSSLFALDETEVKTSADLTLQIWDADSFSGDDFLGSIVINLNAIPRGAQSSKACTLDIFQENNPKVSIFKSKRVRGWWPVCSRDIQGEMTLTGKIDAEFQLMTKDEAESSPAGLGRKEPDPLEPPNRPETSFLWFASPFKALKHIVWARNKGLFLKLLIILFIVYFIILFIYSLPGYTVKRIIGA